MVELKVLEAYARDVCRGVARIDYDAFDALKASTGDYVLIQGKKKTAGKAMPVYPSDEGRKEIRIDQLMRNNGGVSIGDTVTLSKVELKPAISVTVAPSQPIPSIDERYLNDMLDAIPICLGDTVAVPYFAGRLSFLVVRIINIPQTDMAVVTKQTKFLITDKNVSPPDMAEEPRYNAITIDDLIKNKLVKRYKYLYREDELNKAIEDGYTVEQFLPRDPSPRVASSNEYAFGGVIAIVSKLVEVSKDGVAKSAD